MPRDRWTLYAWAATLVLLGLCLLPKRYVPAGERIGPSIPHQDKVVHFVMFGAFGLCWSRAGQPLATRPTRLRVALVLGAAAVLAVATELLQGLDAIHRDPDVFDALADFAGAVAGVAVALRGLPP
jgi:VanZ family protein